ncbi:LysR family transcriptional regulator [Burkholderia sp. Ac-20345]|uniref:LysR family transcriptional regulator n=1 Tax=Burkholderia sp. Ac-20345 TaxID=2703891 RepID=UPI00197BE4CA|nr:LysR family transcriptional regulator [Burkholderia sp. Ac-20345]MBN3778142.1 LysR family transcriptional regulator [Burkholderia sp. Ac-20345]
MEATDRQLRYFVCIAESGTLSKAADVLDQTQSGLSKQLAALESSIGQPLFARTGRGVELTEAGMLLYNAVQPAYRDIDFAVESVRRQGVTQGTVRLATVHTLSYYFTADLVARFIGTHPQVNLSILGRSSPEVVALVECGKADIGLVYDSVVDAESLVSHPLFDDDMALIVRAESPLAGPQDLTRIPLRLVGFPAHYALRRMLQSAGLQPEFSAEAETIDTMLELVSSGIGDCVLPSNIPDRLLANYGLRKLPVESPMLRRRVVAITHAGKRQTPLMKAFLQCTTKLADELRGGRPE